MTAAVAAGFSDGIADAMLVTAGIVLVALIAVRLVWPGRGPAMAESSAPSAGQSKKT